MSRSALVWADTAASPEGYLYVSYGNIRDIQPWHGWIFELSVGAWRSGGPSNAISGVMLTTAEDDCGIEGQSGSRDMICGGGVWTPAGPVVAKRAGESDFSLIVPTGNGMLDPTREQYANAVLRAPRGLQFAHGCDPAACESFDPKAPTEAGAKTCQNMFMPRLREEDAVPAPSSGICEGDTLLQCYAALDYDLGAGTPALVELGTRSVWVMPAKDGSVFMFDADSLGTMYDRMVITDQCGTDDDPCDADWAGTMVTDPAIVESGGEKLALLPTFMFDRSHPAGLVALAIVDGAERPHFERRWQLPAADSREARERFRRHPSRVTTFAFLDRTYAALIDVAEQGSGSLLLASVDDGVMRARVSLKGRGRRYVRPLFHRATLWTTSCADNSGPGELEAFSLTAQ